VRIGINPISWTNDDLPALGGETPLETALTEGRAIGYEGFELGNKFPREPDALRAVLARHGLACVSGWYSGRLARRSVDREPFGHGTQVQQQRPVERDGAPHGIHFDVTIGHVTAADAILNDPSSAVFAIEPSCFHVTTDGGIERARGVRGDEKRELNRFKQDGTRSHGLAGPA